MFFINQVQNAMTFDQNREARDSQPSHGFMFSPHVVNVLKQSEMSSPDFNHRESLKEMDMNVQLMPL